MSPTTTRSDLVVRLVDDLGGQCDVRDLARELVRRGLVEQREAWPAVTLAMLSGRITADGDTIALADREGTT